MCDSPRSKVALLSGGWDRPYTFGLTSALVRGGVPVELIAGDDLTSADFGNPPALTVLNYRVTNGPADSFFTRARRLVGYYRKLIAYAWRAEPRVFHILWNNGHDVFDRVILMLYYRLLGRTVHLTAHNVNAGIRDNRDSLLNRLTLRFQYRACQHVFVHTDEMKHELISHFGVSTNSVSVVPFGINNAVPRSDLSPVEARQRLGLASTHRVLLFFGNIAPYKGLEYLVQAFLSLPPSGNYRLVVAGRVAVGCEDYWAGIEELLKRVPDRKTLFVRNEFIPDEETEVYFKAADLLILPYLHIYQSGVLFLGFSFGLPAAVSDVGNLKSEVLGQEAGTSFAPRDSEALRGAVERYFASELGQRADLERRAHIVERANRSYSWDRVAQITTSIYFKRTSSGRAHSVSGQPIDPSSRLG